MAKKTPHDPNYEEEEDDDLLGFEEAAETAREPAAVKYATSEAPEENVSAQRLLIFITRVERFEEEKRGVMDDIKDVYSEAKSTGFDVKIIRKIVGARRKEASDLREEEELYTMYKAAIGMS